MIGFSISYLQWHGHKTIPFRYELIIRLIYQKKRLIIAHFK